MDTSAVPAVIVATPRVAGPARSAVAYYPWFDWLRAALAITVFLTHDGLVPWKDAGNFAVQVFFALSGWLIGGILLRVPREELTHFYFNRAVRIWVPYYIALALLVGASLLHDRVTWKWGEFVVYKAMMVYNLFGPPQLATHRADMPLQGTGNGFWSVNAEDQFYLLAPIVLVLLRDWGRSVWVWLGITAAAWALLPYSAISFGVLAAVVAYHHGDVHRAPLVRLALVCVALAAALGMAQPALYPMLSPICGVCIVLLLAVQGKQSLVGTVAGGMSYPLYLNAWIGVFISHAVLVRFGLRESAAAHVLSFVLNIAIAVSMYWWIDRRLLARRRELFTPQRARYATGFAVCMIALGVVFGRLVSA